jgi:CheY-like chemotaxis protein
MSSNGLTVLLVEDDDRDALLIRKAFSDLGLEDDLRTVRSPEEAIAALTAESPGSALPSLILVNLALSRKSDFKILRWMRRQQSAVRRIPYITLAASRQPPGFEEAYDLGAVSYLVKPLDRDALRSMLKAVIDFWKLDGRR